MSNTTSPTAKSSSNSAQVHSAQAENVLVQSVVQSETQSKVSIANNKKIADLMARLGTTYHQVDKYSRKRTEEINEAVAESIKKIVAETQLQQQQLLDDANLRTNEIENEFKSRLQEYVAKLDNEKAALLVQLERDLDVRQEAILESARKRIDDLNSEANRLKMNVLKDCQAQSSAEITKITEQVAALEHQEASRRLASTTTTTITTKSVAAGETHAHDHSVTNDKSTTHVETLKSSSSSSPTSESLFFIASVALWQVTKALVIKDQESVADVDQPTTVVVNTVPSIDDTVSSAIATNEGEKLSVQSDDEEKHYASNDKIDGNGLNKRNSEDQMLTSTVEVNEVVQTPLNDDKDGSGLTSIIEGDEKETKSEEAQKSCDANDEETMTTSTTERHSQAEEVDEEEPDDVGKSEDDQDATD
ncbi:unnamed protein product [Rotaria sp. Silwood1]|nr:unnamed protein product [Rotaria sp. Silwood1]